MKWCQQGLEVLLTSAKQLITLFSTFTHPPVLYKYRILHRKLFGFGNSLAALKKKASELANAIYSPLHIFSYSHASCTGTIIMVNI